MGLAAHKGYATPEHRRALVEHGPCGLHRRSFAPCAGTEMEMSELGELDFDVAEMEN